MPDGSSVRFEGALAGEAEALQLPEAFAEPNLVEATAQTAAELPFAAYLLAALGAAIAIVAWRWRLATLPQGLGPPRRVLPSAGLPLLAALLVAGSIGAAAAASFAPQGDLPRRALAMAGLVGGQLLLLPLVASLRGSERFSEATGRASLPSGRAVAIGLLAMALAYPAIATLGNLLQWMQSTLLGDERSRIAHDTLAAIVAEPAGVWAAVLLTLVVTGVPLCEEVAYRRLLQPAIGGLLPAAGRLGAIAIASGLFALLHLPAIPPGSRWGAVGMLIGVGMVLGWTYERTGRLRAAVAGHALFNLGNVAIAVAAA